MSEVKILKGVVFNEPYSNLQGLNSDV